MLRVLFDTQRFRVIGHLCKFALGLLKVRVVLDVGLDFGVLRDALQFGRIGNGRCLRLRDVCLAVGHFVVALVGFHIERHAAFCAFETRFVPCFVQTLKLLDGVNHLLATGTGFIHLAAFSSFVCCFCDCVCMYKPFIYTTGYYC